MVKYGEVGLVRSGLGLPHHRKPGVCFLTKNYGPVNCHCTNKGTSEISESLTLPCHCENRVSIDWKPACANQPSPLSPCFRGPQSKINKTKAAYCILLPSKINEALSRSRGKPTWPTWVRDGENQNKDAEDWISNVWNVESTTFMGRWQNPLLGWWSHHSWLLNPDVEDILGGSQFFSHT